MRGRQPGIRAGLDLSASRFTPPSRDGFLLFSPGNAASAEGYDPDYYAHVARHDRSHFWFVARSRLLLWVVQRHAANVRDYMELGCGTGAVLAAFAAAQRHWNLAGTEVLMEGLRHARKRAPAAFLFQADALHLPLHDCLDLAGAFDVLEHVEDDVTLLTGLHRTLRASGLVLLTVPQHPALWSQADVFARHRRRYTRMDLLAKLTSSGFEPVLVTSFSTFLLPPLLVSRLVRKGRADPWRVEIPRWLNTILGVVLTAERLMIRMGARLPFGGSLLVLARKARAERSA